MAESKTASAAGKSRSSEIVENLLAKGKKNGGTLTYGELIDALQKQDLTPDEIDTMYDRGEAITWSAAELAKKRLLKEWGFFWDPERQCKRLGLE